MFKRQSALRNIFTSLFLVTLCHAQEVPEQQPKKKPEKPLSGRVALEKLNVLIGDWRGIGQLKRNSRRGAWSEKSSWVWDFANKKSPALRLVSKGSQQVRGMRIEFDLKSGLYVLKIQFPDTPKEKPVILTARPDAKKLVFGSQNKEAKDQYRVSFRILSPKRVTLLVEKGKTNFRRVFGVGYTRAGTSIAERGDGKPMCIVTGGTGSIRVTYKGKAYYVCCSGCQQAFADDPEGVLADFAARLKAEKAQKAAKKKQEKPKTKP